MLFTRCPECDTTFRVTDETLKKANGQVRCGRCATVFNAYAELHDPTAKSFEPETANPRPAPEERPRDSAPAAAAAGTPPIPEPRGDAAQSDGAAAGIGSVADVVAEAELAAIEDETESAPALEAPTHDDLSATEIDRVLASNLSAQLPQTSYAWPAHGARSESPAVRRRWAIAAAVASVAFGAQMLHHFRSDVAGHPTFGPWLVQTYGMLGVELTPNWDVRQYQILDWVATAEPNARGIGSLKITARIQNRGPLRQPYPAVQLRLKDRTEAAVGSRMFTPSEYLPPGTPKGQLMSPGETARAEIEVVDPGPDAYGFELDVCIEVEASLVTCGTDEVFL